MKVIDLIRILEQVNKDAKIMFRDGDRDGTWLEYKNEATVTVVNKVNTSSDYKIGDVIFEFNN